MQNSLAEVELTQEWSKVVDFIKHKFNKEAVLKAVLFIVGLREYGKKKTKFTKEEKQDLMNLAFCKALSFGGYFEVAHLDGEGWPVWKQSKPIPVMNVKEQEEFIKAFLVQYFVEEELI